MVGGEAAVAIILGRETALNIGKEDTSSDSGSRILEAVEDGTEGGISGVAGLLTATQEIINGVQDRRHWSEEEEAESKRERENGE